MLLAAFAEEHVRPSNAPTSCWQLVLQAGHDAIPAPAAPQPPVFTPSPALHCVHACKAQRASPSSSCSSCNRGGGSGPDACSPPGRTGLQDLGGDSYTPPACDAAAFAASCAEHALPLPDDASIMVRLPSLAQCWSNATTAAKAEEAAAVARAAQPPVHASAGEHQGQQAAGAWGACAGGGVR